MKLTAGKDNGSRAIIITHWLVVFSIVCLFPLGATLSHAAEYDIDTEGMHAFIQFRIKHLGYSMLIGHFKKFEGRFSYDEANPAASKVEIKIDASSIDSHLAERDKHLRGKDFLDVKAYPTANFSSTSFDKLTEQTAILKGNLTLRGVTRPIVIDLTFVGEGPDPWGGRRRGFTGTTNLKLKDFGINTDLGPASREVEMYLAIEGVQRK